MLAPSHVRDSGASANGCRQRRETKSQGEGRGCRRVCMGLRAQTQGHAAWVLPSPGHLLEVTFCTSSSSSQRWRSHKNLPCWAYERIKGFGQCLAQLNAPFSLRVPGSVPLPCVASLHVILTREVPCITLTHCSGEETSPKSHLNWHSQASHSPLEGKVTILPRPRCWLVHTYLHARAVEITGRGGGESEVQTPLCCSLAVCPWSPRSLTLLLNRRGQ